MRFIMFQQRFENAITSGKKDQTIRQKSKRQYMVGEVVSLRVWTGRPYMSKQREFAQAQITEVLDFGLYPQGDGYNIYVDNLRLKYFSDVESFVKRDGFNDVSDMMEFFNKLPFEGTLYRWSLIG